MTWPKDLEVIIEGFDKEQKATLFRVVPFAPDVAEYETSDGIKFAIDQEYLKFCQDNKKPPHIPEQVIRVNAESRKHLAEGEALIKQSDAQQSSPLILPTGNEENKV